MQRPNRAHVLRWLLVVSQVLGLAVCFAFSRFCD